MSDWDYTSAEKGDQLPALTLGPINQDDLVLYANASGDQNPIHIERVMGQSNRPEFPRKCKCLINAP